MRVEQNMRVGGLHARGRGRDDVRVIGRRGVLDKGAEDTVSASAFGPFACLLDPIAKGDNVQRDVVLLELLGETDERALGVGRGVLEGRADKDDDALSRVFVLAVLERQLRYRDRGRDGRRSAEVGRGVVDGCHDLAELFCVRD